MTVNDADGRAELAKPAPVSPARFMRQLHDGNGYNVVWQTLIFVAGLVPALLGITGVMMWLRTRVWRADVARRKKARAAA